MATLEEQESATKREHGTDGDFPSSSSSSNDSVVLLDGDLQQAVRAELGKEKGPLTKADLAMLETLNADDREIESLSGLEHA